MEKGGFPMNSLIVLIFVLSVFMVLFIAMIAIFRKDSTSIEVKVAGPCFFSVKICKDKHNKINNHRDT